MQDLKYPVGKFHAEANATDELRSKCIADIECTPARLWEAIRGLDAAQLDTPYREGGWTVRQVIHHVADSHMNSYVRFRLALTEENPLIKPYEEAQWAELRDARTTDPEVSLALLAALHTRWVALLKTFGQSEWGRTFRHPELGEVSLEKNVQLYAWHGRHHAAHITGLRERMGWA